jgi:hypothetical protein
MFGCLRSIEKGEPVSVDGMLAAAGAERDPAKR